jgi:serine/threonine protein phosphatase PrpC
MELALENAYYQIDSDLATAEGKAKLLKYRDGETIEEKKRPRFMEDEDTIGTALCMGSTAVTCLIYRNKVYTANLGDSRAIMVAEHPSNTKQAQTDLKRNAIS